ncbi:peptidoglycan D,D-transpeptidase FtsI family protein [Canibacter zhoujuaniae]|uniref:peptidoglycan D,D-transpeptidase FtsI family protein n=1 Tax=Canibacter zhoujuaniae TaxID=2708343 RepID=UPI00141E95A0|nr:penicillin-binding protein 2 [Canibacter zhoujuaniae]
MNKQLKRVTRVIFALFLALFLGVSMVQFVRADEYRANELNERSHRNAFLVERGTILVAGQPVAYSIPTNDTFRFQRQYPNGELYAPITGYFSHYQGSSGIEQAENQALSGVASNQFFTRIQRVLSGQPPMGSAVELTIDPVAQQKAFESLQGMKGAVVALDAETGAILAMASTPSYDPNTLSLNNNAEVIENYSALEQNPDKPLFNRAVSGDLYTPGSVFKIITAAAALESGKYTPDSSLDDAAAFTLPGTSSVMRNASRGVCVNGEKATVTEAFVRSCNIPFAELAGGLEANAIQDMAAKFGFGNEIQVPLRVAPSTVGAPSDAAQRAITAIGQLDVRVTPLQMALISATVANGGEMMQPTLVERVITPDFRVESQREESVLATPISKVTAAQLKAMMQAGVVDPAGLARNAAISGAVVGGKTGTAEIGNDAAGNPLPYNLWFTGFAERDGRKIAVAVVVEEGGGAAHNFSALSGDVPTSIGQQVMEAVLSE